MPPCAPGHHRQARSSPTRPVRRHPRGRARPAASRANSIAARAAAARARPGAADPGSLQPPSTPISASWSWVVIGLVLGLVGCRSWPCWRGRLCGGGLGLLGLLLQAPAGAWSRGPPRSSAPRRAGRSAACAGPRSAQPRWLRSVRRLGGPVAQRRRPCRRGSAWDFSAFSALASATWARAFSAVNWSNRACIESPALCTTPSRFITPVGPSPPRNAVTPLSAVPSW